MVVKLFLKTILLKNLDKVSGELVDNAENEFLKDVVCEFEKLSAQFGNRVSAEISGLEGERLAYKSLQTIKRPLREAPKLCMTE